MFAFHITDSVSIEPGLLYMVSNADSDAVLFLDWFLVFLISFSSHFLSQASWPTAFFFFLFCYLISFHRLCMFKNFLESTRWCSWKIIFASCNKSFYKFEMLCSPCLFQKLFIDTLWIFPPFPEWSGLVYHFRDPSAWGEQSGSSVILSASFISVRVRGTHSSWGIFLFALIFTRVWVVVSQMPLWHPDCFKCFWGTTDRRVQLVGFLPAL